MDAPENIQRSAKRLLSSQDFNDVMTYLMNEQATVCLEMDVNNKDQLQLARVYFDALRTVPDLVENLLVKEQK